MENAIVSLAIAARIAGIPADPESLCRAFPSREPSAIPLLLLPTFGLITPLFSQVIIDKVLIHKGLSTLDVLVLGLFLINIFEMILGVTRTYLFSHTMNRVDVILGAKLCCGHLLNFLPVCFTFARFCASIMMGKIYNLFFRNTE